MTQKQLADKCGIGQSTLAEMERVGQGSTAVPQLARALKCSVTWLATGQGSEEDEFVWPLDDDLLPAVLSLDREGMRRLNNLVRAHLGMDSLSGEGQTSRADDSRKAA